MHLVDTMRKPFLLQVFMLFVVVATLDLTVNAEDALERGSETRGSYIRAWTRIVNLEPNRLESTSYRHEDEESANRRGLFEAECNVKVAGQKVYLKVKCHWGKDKTKKEDAACTKCLEGKAECSCDRPIPKTRKIRPTRKPFMKQKPSLYESDDDDDDDLNVNPSSSYSSYGDDDSE